MTTDIIIEVLSLMISLDLDIDLVFVPLIVLVPEVVIVDLSSVLHGKIRLHSNAMSMFTF